MMVIKVRIMIKAGEIMTESSMMITPLGRKEKGRRIGMCFTISIKSPRILRVPVLRILSHVLNKVEEFDKIIKENEARCIDSQQDCDLPFHINHEISDPNG